MFIKGREQGAVPLLTYWTRLYVLVLLLSLLLMAVIAGAWIRFNAYQQRYDLLDQRADQLAEEYGQKLEAGVAAERLQNTRVFRVGGFAVPILVQLADGQGRLHTVRSARGQGAAGLLNQLSTQHRAVLSGKTVREKVEIEGQSWLRVGVPVYQSGSVSGALYVSMADRGVLNQVGRLYLWLALVTATIGLAGWLVLYFLSRKLTLPLRQLAVAAQSVAGGEYSPCLPQRVREKELQQLVASFREMAAQLQKLERLRSDLLAGVSHELRTPLTSIRGMIQALQSKVVTGPQADEFLRISLEEAKRLQRMVEDLLDFSSLESGAAQLEKELLDFSDLVNGVIRQFQVMPGCDNLAFKNNLPAGPVWLSGDPDRLRQIVLNLFNNSFGASASEVEITLQDGGGRVELDIRDNGGGISPEDRPYIFERFYRGKSGRSRPRGLGLGLTVSRLLARAHGGELALLETSPVGTTFRLTLPDSPPDENYNHREHRE